MDVLSISAAPGRYRLEWGGSVLELAAQRTGLRTEVVLFRDGHVAGEGTGAMRVLLPLPDDAGAQADGQEQGERMLPTVLVRTAFPGVISRACLLVPRLEPVTGVTQEDGDGATDQPAPKPRQAKSGAAGEGLDELPKCVAELAGFDRAERHLFGPPPGTLAARLLALQREHPKLYASRRVAAAVGEVVLGVLGVALFFQLILSGVVDWVTERLPRFDWPSIPWPDIDLQSIPWPDIDWPDLPDVTLPGWLLAVVGTAKYWVPILIAIGLAAKEVERRKTKQGGGSRRDAHR